MNRTLKILACMAMLIGLLAPMPSAQAQVKWNSIEQASQAKIGTRIYLVDFYTDWCGYCKKMDRDTYSNATVKQIIDRYYYPVKFNAESSQSFSWFGQTYKGGSGRRGVHEFARGVQGYPTTVLFAADGKAIQAIPGYIGPKDFVIILWYFASGDYNRYPYERYQRIFDKEIRPAMEKALKK